MAQDGPTASDFFSDPVTASLVDRVLAMEPGSRLPSERELGQELGVSRTALRDRLGHLEALGVLRRRVGAGTFVHGVDPEVLSQALTIGLLATDMTRSSLHSVRWALERQAAREASLAGDPVAVAHLTVALSDMRATADPAELHEADLRFHAALIQASASPALVFVCEALGTVLNRTVELRPNSDHPRIHTLHTAIHDAVTAGDADGAMRAVDDHFLWSLDPLATSAPDQRT